MSFRNPIGHRAARALAVVALVGFCGCKTVHEEIKPVRETTLSVARSGGEITLSWLGVRGSYYTVMYSDARGGRARWAPLPDAINIPARVSGEPILVYDRLPANQQRYYRLVQDTKPLVP